jgi:hypothetical protein
LSSLLEDLPVVLNESTPRLDLPPPTHLSHIEHKGGSVFRLSDFVVTPSQGCEDAAESGRDETTGQPKSLTATQRQELRRTGKLSVPSRRFENQYHTWQIHSAVYSGPDTVSTSWKQGAGAALDQLVHASDALFLVEDEVQPDVDHDDLGTSLPVRHRSRRYPPFFSLGGAWQSVRRAVGVVGDGLTQWTRRPRRRKYSDEAIHHLVHEARESYVRFHLGNHDNDPTKQEKETNHAEQPLLFFQDKHCDYYVCSSTLSDDVWQALVEDGQWPIANKPNKDEISRAGFARNYLRSLRRSMADSNDMDPDASTDENRRAAQASPRAAKIFRREQIEAIKDATAAKWIETVANCTTLSGGPYGNLEAERLKALHIRETMQEQDRITVEQRAQETAMSKGGVFSLSMEWQRRQKEKYLAMESRSLQSTLTKRWIQTLQEQGLYRMARIETLRMEFDSQHGQALKERFEGLYVALPPQVFSVLQWDPKHWQVSGRFVVRHKDVEVSLDRSWWRLRHAFLHFWSITKEIAGGSVHFLLHGPLSFRALWSRKPFYAIEQPQRDETTFTQTLASRLDRFWSALADVRTKFEAEPDTGLIGKSLSRLFLRTYLAIKGTMGTMWIVTFMIVGTLLASTMAAVLLVVSPVVGLTWALSMLAFTTLIYDVTLALAWGRRYEEGLHKHFRDCNQPSFSSPLVKIALAAPLRFIGAAVQSAGALASGCVGRPALFTLRFALATVRAGLRTGRDTLTWLLLRRAARVPATAHDTWLASRIHGPGLASIQYFRLPLWAAKLAVLLKLDSIRLELHNQLRVKELGDAPYAAYTSIFSLKMYGIQTKPLILSPMHVATEMAYDVGKEIDPSMTTKFQPNVVDLHEDVWDRASQTLRSHHPDFVEREWELARTRKPSEQQSIESMDAMVSSLLAQRKWKKKSGLDSSPLQSSVDSITPVLATWIVQTEIRRVRLAESVGLPREVSGTFRLSEEDLNDLWDFTLKQVNIYKAVIQTELEEMSSESQWLDALGSDQISRLFHGQSESSAVRAFTLLEEVFGEESLTRTLEDVDETLVLSSRMEQEDKHLYVWVDNTKATDFIELARRNNADEKITYG